MREGSKGAAELEPGTHSRKRDMNSEMCRSNVSVLEVRIAATGGVHVRSNVAIFGVQRRFRHSVEGVGTAIWTAKRRIFSRIWG